MPVLLLSPLCFSACLFVVRLSPLLVAVAVLRSVNDSRCPVIRRRPYRHLLLLLLSAIRRLLSNTSRVPCSPFPVSSGCSLFPTTNLNTTILRPYHARCRRRLAPLVLFSPHFSVSEQCKSYHAADRADCCLDDPLLRLHRDHDFRILRPPSGGRSQARREE